MTYQELSNYLNFLCEQLIEISQTPDYHKICAKAKEKGSPTLETALNAVIAAIRIVDEGY